MTGDEVRLFDLHERSQAAPIERSHDGLTRRRCWTPGSSGIGAVGAHGPGAPEPHDPHLGAVRAGESGGRSVEPAPVPAHRTDGLVAVGVDFEEAGAPVRRAEEATRSGLSAAQATHGRGAPDRIGVERSRKHVDVDSFWPRHGTNWVRWRGTRCSGSRDGATRFGVRIRAAIAGASRIRFENSIDALTCGRLDGSCCLSQHAGLATDCQTPRSDGTCQDRRRLGGRARPGPRLRSRHRGFTGTKLRERPTFVRLRTHASAEGG